VTELPDLSTFAALFSDRRIYAAIAVSIIAGATRGFSGFGSALIYVPLISAIYDPRTAAVTFLLIDAATGIAVLPTVWREANWREVLPLAAAAVFAGQFGALILQYTDPVALRWGMVVVVLSVLGVLMSGWHYHGRPLLIVTLGVGLIAGLLGGAVQIVGPPIILYWLGSASAAAVIRANFTAFFALFAWSLFITYLTRGLLVAPVIALACILGPLQILSLSTGTRLFHLASAKTYRRVAYGIIFVGALMSMPILDSLIRS
jgi:uncharacterized membrane protein YfcA